MQNIGRGARTAHICATFTSRSGASRVQRAALLKGGDARRRERMIGAIADNAAARLDPAMLANGRLTFPQESFVVLASLR